MFSLGLGSMEFMRSRKGRRWGKYTPMVDALRRGRIKGNLERGYVMFQEFVPGNAFDTRVVIQGDRAWASRRMVREGDFRASGSGVSDLSAKAINPAALELTWRLADAMGVRSLVTDVMQRGDAPVMGEFSFSMAAHVSAHLGGPLAARPRGDRLGRRTARLATRRCSRTSSPKFDRAKRDGALLRDLTERRAATM